MPHIMELFGKTRIVVKDGKVVEVGEPVADWCPVFSKVSNVSRLTSQEAKKNMEYRIRELGMFTPERKLDQGVFVNFGASEIMMTALSRGLIDSTVTVCDGAGTVITDNPALVQGMGALMSGLLETEPIAQIIAGIESRGGIVLDKENARIDQTDGLLRACELGYKNIAVSVVSAAEAGKLRLIEKEQNIDLILIGAHLTGIQNREAQVLISKMDIITSCASNMVRALVHPLLQAGTSVPMFALTQKGKELIIERAKEIDSPILVSTAELPVLPGHKQPRPLI
ncbi:MAG TPA: methanogenesis marker 8 protein [Candidatus Methanoperedens sp.]